LALVSTAPDELPIDLSNDQQRERLPAIYTPQHADIPYRSIIDPEREGDGSLSMGNTSYGRLVGGSHLVSDSDTHYVVPAHRNRNTHYGTAELLALIHDTAHGLNNRFEGTRLAVGNMSTDGGGDIYWSRSHNSGRDADFAFFVEDADGNPVSVVPDLISMRADGTARYHPNWRFDVERNWALIESLVTSQAARVQWVFIYAPLRAKLLDYAEDQGVDEAIIERAENVLRQPSDSARHDDHFHVRIYCSFEDRLEGCVDWGPRWDHVAFNDDELNQRVREIIRGFMDPDPETVRACFNFLERLHPRPSAETIALAVPHQNPEAQLALLDLLNDLGQSGISGPLLPLAESARDDRVRQRIFEVLGSIGDQSAFEGLLAIMSRDGRPLDDGTPLRLLAAHAMRHLNASESLDELIPHLSDEDASVRQAVATVMERTTGHAPANADELSPAEITAHWEQWYAEHKDWRRREWIRTAFVNAGYEVGDVRNDPNLNALIDAVDEGPEQLSYIADRLLNRHTRFWSPLESWSRTQRAEYWKDKMASR
jgi:penicillin-insensitive murein endopeptidase